MVVCVIMIPAVMIKEGRKRYLQQLPGYFKTWNVSFVYKNRKGENRMLVVPASE